MNTKFPGLKPASKIKNSCKAHEAETQIPTLQKEPALFTGTGNTLRFDADPHYRYPWRKGERNNTMALRTRAREYRHSLSNTITSKERKQSFKQSHLLQNFFF